MKLSVSIYCGGFLNLQKTIEEIDRSQVDFIHIDIMDGYFLPAMSAGPGYLDCIREASNTPLDIHFMLEQPDRLMPKFKIASGDFVSFHYESTPHVQRYIDDLKAAGAHVGLAINPATPLSVLDEVLPELDFVNVMTINPGQAGHGMVSYGLNKIARLKQMIQDRRLNTQIELDGASDFNNLPDIVHAGTDICVLGARNCYALGYTYDQAIHKIRKILEES